MRTYKLKLIGLGAIALIVLAWGAGNNGPFSSAQTDCNVIISPDQSLQQAIDQADPDVILCLAPGTWEANILIKKSLTLRGQGQDTQGSWLTQIKSAAWERSAIYISSDSETKVSPTVTIQNIWVYGNSGIGLAVGGTAQLTLINAVISGSSKGIEMRDSAQAALTNLTFSSNAIGLVTEDSGQVTITNSTLTRNFTGLVVRGSSQVKLINTTVASNATHGLRTEDSTVVEVRSSTFEGNGTHFECAATYFICNGIFVSGGEKSRTTIINSKIISNTDWGVATFLKKCGYGVFDPSLYFSGSVTFQGSNAITGNNKAGNHQGEVCLP